MSDNFSQKIISHLDNGMSPLEIAEYFGGLGPFIQKVSKYPYLKALVDSKLEGEIDFYLDESSKRYRLPVQITEVEAEDYDFGKMYDVYVDVIIPEVTNEDDISILYNYLKMYESDTADEWAFLSDKKLNSGMTMVHVLSINGINWKVIKLLIKKTEKKYVIIINNK